VGTGRPYHDGAEYLEKGDIFLGHNGSSPTNFPENSNFGEITLNLSYYPFTGVILLLPLSFQFSILEDASLC
jgi:hypothetical protein